MILKLVWSATSASEMAGAVFETLGTLHIARHLSDFKISCKFFQQAV